MRRPKSEKCPKCGKDMVPGSMPDTWLCEPSCSRAWTRQALTDARTRAWMAGEPERAERLRERQQLMLSFPWAARTKDLENVYTIEGFDGLYVKDEAGDVEAVEPSKYSAKVERYRRATEREVFEKIARKKWKTRR